MDAKLIKNDDGTFRLVDLEGNDFMLEFMIGNTLHKTLVKKDLTLGYVHDIQMYDVNIINLNDYC